MVGFKSFLAVILCLALLIPVVSCNGDNASESSNDTTSDTVSADGFSSVGDNEDTSENSSVSGETVVSGEHDVSGDETSDYGSVDVSGDASSEDDLTSDDNTSEDNTETRFSVLSPEVEFDKVWENGKMELFNTDFRMSEELAKKFERQFASFANAQSVALIELDTNMAFCYSKDQKIATASSIKGPMGLFAYKCIDDGIISWDTVKKYQVWHYQENSTGWVQNSPFGSQFTVKTLMDYMIRISDNQAYLMMKELVGVENFEQMMAELGSTRVIPVGSNWGYITAWEMASVWREIYYYSLSSESGAELFDRFMHAQYNYIWRAIPQYEAAHKSGWSGKAFNDAGVVFADGHQYVLVVLMGRSGVEDQRSHYQFNAVTRLLAELMVEYNAYIESDSSADVSEESEISE